MIIFDLDGTLADCEHRRHFVDPSKRSDCYYHELSNLKQMEGWYYLDDISFPQSRVKFKPDWKSFYEACDNDEPIEPVMRCLRSWMETTIEIQIWSGRSESVRNKTNDWLDEHLSCEGDYPYFPKEKIKMRPVGNTEPDDKLKEKWLNERCTSQEVFCGEREVHDIEFVFDDRPKVVRMWRRRGIFVFNCCQYDYEF